MENKTFICSCHSMEHQITFRYQNIEEVSRVVNLLDKESGEEYLDDDELYINVFLHTNKGFFKRLWRGLKFAFGYKSRYGQWDEIILDRKSEDELLELLTERKKVREQIKLS